MLKADAPPPEGSQATNICEQLSSGRRREKLMRGPWRVMRASTSLRGKAFSVPSAEMPKDCHATNVVSVSGRKFVCACVAHLSEQHRRVLREQLALRSKAR